MRDKTAVLILAAGKGERMRSDLPKVLHPLGGRPLLSYPLETAKALRAGRVVVLVGHQADRIRQAFSDKKIRWVLQRPQLGTAHAVLCGLRGMKNFKGLVFILYGDVPFLRLETLRKMKDLLLEEGASLVLLTAQMEDPSGYGRVIRNEGGRIVRIVEEKEAGGWEKEIREINSGIYLARTEDLWGPLGRVKKSIVKGEYYLTDLVEALIREGKNVLSVTVSDSEEVMGINSHRELAEADRILQKRIRKKWMETGVAMLEPASIRIGGDVRMEPGVILHPGVILSGKTRIGRDTEVLAYSVIEESVIGKGARIGPFAHLRPGSRVGDGAHVGNFVEMKKTRLGTGAKANHLSYLGDATIGPGANIGAGTITCNYDGVKKFKTVIGAKAFIGSDTQLVAPVTVGKNAYVGSGTTVTKNVPAGALAISRVEQKNILKWNKKGR